MFGIRISSKVLLLFLAALVLALPACSAVTPTPAEPTPAPVQPTAVPTQPVPPTNTPLPPTPTILPTATASATPTAIPPTATNTVVPADQQVRIWCIPKDKAMAVKAPEDPAEMPDGAVAGTFKDNLLKVTKPDLSCMLVFNFGQPLASGSVVEILDGYGSPWLKVNAEPSNKYPGVSYAALTHTYVTDPPFWTITYGLRVMSGDSVVWSGKLQIDNNWIPEMCWDHVLPNYKTLLCHKQQDVHPWDPGYPYLLTPTVPKNK